jgi:hypothetical protein
MYQACRPFTGMKAYYFGPTGAFGQSQSSPETENPAGAGSLYFLVVLRSLSVDSRRLAFSNSSGGEISGSGQFQRMGFLVLRGSVRGLFSSLRFRTFVLLG